MLKKLTLMSVCYLSLTSVELSATSRGAHVHKPAYKGSPYMESVRKTGSVIMQNILRMIASSSSTEDESLSVMKSLRYRRDLHQVARLFAYAEYIGELRSDKAKYGPVDDLGYSRNAISEDQQHARGQYLASDLFLFFKKGSQVKNFHKKAYRHFNDFYQSTYAATKEAGLGNDSEKGLSRRELVLYLKLIAEQNNLKRGNGNLDKLGLRSLKQYESGGSRWHYTLRWDSVNKSALSAAIAKDEFKLLDKARYIIRMEDEAAAEAATAAADAQQGAAS